MNKHCQSEREKSADLEIGDTAGLETCATGAMSGYTDRPGRGGGLDRRRMPGGGRVAVIITGLLLSARARAQDGAVELPQLHPFHAEFLPTFWERHGVLVVITGLGLAGLAGLALWWWLRPQPPVVVPPEVQAREALAALPADTGAGETLSRVAQILRGYVRRAFDLPPAELTTTEFCRELSGSAEVGPELAGILTDYLRENDRRKFSAAGTAPSRAETVAAALALIERCEARRAALRAAATAAPPAPHPAA